LRGNASFTFNDVGKKTSGIESDYLAQIPIGKFEVLLLSLFVNIFKKFPVIQVIEYIHHNPLSFT
jgi:hypothetical protein